MTDLPVACALTPEAARARRAALLTGLLAHATERVEQPDGYRLRFVADGDILAAIARTIDAERLCCRFLRFQVTVEPDEGPIWLDVSGPAGTREFLSALFDV